MEGFTARHAPRSQGVPLCVMSTAICELHSQRGPLPPPAYVTLILPFAFPHCNALWTARPSKPPAPNISVLLTTSIWYSRVYTVVQLYTKRETFTFVSYSHLSLIKWSQSYFTSKDPETQDMSYCGRSWILYVLQFSRLSLEQFRMEF